MRLLFLLPWLLLALFDSAGAADLKTTLHVGKPGVYESKSPGHPVSVLFEDDGAVAYFYALTTTSGVNPILDTLHVYDVPNVKKENMTSSLEIRWSRDGWKALLLLNDFPHAAFDFKARRGWNRNGFPPPNRLWTEFGHEWDNKVLDLFK